MAGYVKKIAVIKQIKGGFSADGGEICGLVKAEAYAGFLKVDASLLNFAPVSEGRYVFGISDGVNTVTFEERVFEGESAMDLSNGFAFLVCFCHLSVAPIAAASCGQTAYALPALKEEMTRRENLKPKQPPSVQQKPQSVAAVQDKPRDASPPTGYDDEAITEINYYEQREPMEDGGGVCPPENAQEESRAVGEDEAYNSACAGDEEYGTATDGDGRGERREVSDDRSRRERKRDEAARPKLAQGSFYSRMAADVEKIFTTYARAEDVEAAMEGSRFVKIPYGNGRHYIFGVLEVEGVPRYICYGVPASENRSDGAPLGFSSLIPTAQGGYYMLFQDAATGVSVDLTVE